MVSTEEKRKMGKKSKSLGSSFELRVRKDLESKGFICDKWSNNVEFVNDGSISDFIHQCKDCGQVFSFLADYNGVNGGELRMSEERVILNIRQHNKDHKIQKIAEGPECSKFGKLIQTKAKWNNFTKSMMMGSGGFPDFVVFRALENRNTTSWVVEKNSMVPFNYLTTDIIGVEAKLTGELDKAEKEKCKWLLDNNIFSKILIASKHKIKNRIHIEYEDVKIKYQRFFNAK